MATEIEPIANPKWPSGVRLPVALTFEHQSGEGAPLLAHFAVAVLRPISNE